MPLVQPKQLAQSGGGSTPGNVVYVSPDFPDVFPFYSTIQMANVNCPATSTIHVYPGTYDMNIDLCHTMYCEPGVVITDGAEQSTFGLSNASLLLGFAKFVFSRAGSGVVISYPYNSGSVAKIFECDSIEYSGSVTRDTSGAIYVRGGPYSGQCTIRVRYLNSRVYHSCPSALGQYDINARLNIECDYIYQFYQQYQSDSSLLPHSNIRCNEFVYIEIEAGTCICDFEVNYSPNRAVYVARTGELTLRNGLIYATDTEGAIRENALVEVIENDDKPLLRLEQCTLYIRKGACVRMVSANGSTSGMGRTGLTTKNCTLSAGINSIIGDIANYCTVRNEGGGSCASLPVTGVTQLVSNILVDTNVIV